MATGLSPGLRAFTTGVSEGCKQRAGKRVAHDLPFRMPLHRKCETARGRHTERLDHAVGRARLDGEPLAEALDALAVERVDTNALARGQRAQHPARLEGHLVSR